ncbi:MAG TPA: outer membrane beta-barrel protein [Pseudolabrys sp.]
MRQTVAALLAAAAFVAGGISSALAADMPARAPMYTKAPLMDSFNWTGFYVGATAGAASTTSDVTLNPVNGAIPNYGPDELGPVSALGSQSFKGTNAVFGGKAGYNQQFNAWVFGVEADFSSFHFNKSSTVTGNPFSAFPVGSMTLNTNVSSNWLATVRPRIGYAFDRTLVYATGGVAFGKVSFSNTDLEFAPLGGGFGTEASSVSQTKAGWAAGAGLEYGLTPNWIVSAEYLHVDLGTLNALGLVTSGDTSTATLNFSTRLRSDIVRAGIAYKF